MLYLWEFLHVIGSRNSHHACLRQRLLEAPGNDSTLT